MEVLLSRISVTQIKIHLNTLYGQGIPWYGKRPDATFRQILYPPSDMKYFKSEEYVCKPPYIMP